MSGARAPASSVPGESAPSEPSATRERVRVAGRLLAHPLIITLFSALLAAVVLPPLTRAWQDRQKELELKRDLVTQIAETSTRAVRRGIIGQQDEARREWLVERFVSNAPPASGIRAYLRKKALVWTSWRRRRCRRPGEEPWTRAG